MAKGAIQIGANGNSGPLIGIGGMVNKAPSPLTALTPSPLAAVSGGRSGRSDGAFAWAPGSRLRANVTALHRALPVSRWEYQVIHLNVEDSSQAPQAPGPGPASAPAQPPTPPAPETPPIAGQPVFSKAYLEQEFPDFYSNPPSQPPQQSPPGQQQANHPALQLQQFLNGHGQQGWSLVGIYPLGSLLMMFFRRRIPEPEVSPIPVAAPIAQQQPASAGGAAQIPPLEPPLPRPGSAPPVAPQQADSGTPAVTHWLQQIMQRLESLEGRIPTSPSEQPASAADPIPEPGVAQVAPLAPLAEPIQQKAVGPSERRLRRRSSASQPPVASASASPAATVSGPSALPEPGSASQAVILSASHLAILQEEVGLPTFHAAKALDFRSYATLAGYGSRHGYPLGLVKEGPNQMAAVYLGLEQGDRGGRARRLWAVVTVARLRALEG